MSVALIVANPDPKKETKVKPIDTHPKALGKVKP